MSWTVPEPASTQWHASYRESAGALSWSAAHLAEKKASTGKSELRRDCKFKPDIWDMYQCMGFHKANANISKLLSKPKKGSSCAIIKSMYQSGGSSPYARETCFLAQAVLTTATPSCDRSLVYQHNFLAAITHEGVVCYLERSVKGKGSCVYHRTSNRRWE